MEAEEVEAHEAVEEAVGDGTAFIPVQLRKSEGVSE